MNEVLSNASRWAAPAPPQGPEFGGSSPVGLVVILLMGIAVAFLVRSMNGHLRKLPRSFESADSTNSSDSAASNASTGSAGSAKTSQPEGDAARREGTNNPIAASAGTDVTGETSGPAAREK